jgi:hypothetical protein
MLKMGDEVVELTLDPGRGADLLSLVHRTSGIEVLFSTPWRAHADDIRWGISAPRASDPVAGFLERYRGGWNLLCPNAGPPRLVHGSPVGFHGEAVAAAWEIVHAGPAQVRLRTSLFSVPVDIERSVLLDGGCVSLVDVLTNTSDIDLVIDYVSHPAFGGPFIEHGCTIATNARTYTADPDTVGGLTAGGSRTPWPGAGEDDPAGLSAVPPQDAARMAFGWLEDFDGEPWATITSEHLGLQVRIAWDATYLPFAWFWQELGWTPDFPWHRRARAVAIEPASTVTSGPRRASSLTLRARETVRIPVSLTLHETKDAR